MLTAEQTQLFWVESSWWDFIDEAYSFGQKTVMSDFGIESSIPSLNLWSDNRDEIMIIFAGYTKEMEGM